MQEQYSHIIYTYNIYNYVFPEFQRLPKLKCNYVPCLTFVCKLNSKLIICICYHNNCILQTNKKNELEFFHVKRKIYNMYVYVYKAFF